MMRESQTGKLDKTLSSQKEIYNPEEEIFQKIHLHGSVDKPAEHMLIENSQVLRKTTKKIDTPLQITGSKLRPGSA